MGHSFPVHPTQIYESVIGLVLLAILLWQRKHQRFRGQIFFLFAFGYGYLRFLIEAFRDDTERGEFGPMMGEHWLISGALLVMSVAFVFGISLGITNTKVRNVSRVLAFIPPIAAFLILRPISFGKQHAVQLSTSQWIGMLSAVICAWFYAKYWETARKSPKLAMGLESLGDIKATQDDASGRRKKSDEDDDAGNDDDEASAAGDADDAPKKTPAKKKGLVGKKKAKVEENEDAEASEAAKTSSSDADADAEPKSATKSAGDDDENAKKDEPAETA